MRSVIERLLRPNEEDPVYLLPNGKPQVGKYINLPRIQKFTMQNDKGDLMECVAWIQVNVYTPHSWLSWLIKPEVKTVLCVSNFSTTIQVDIVEGDILGTLKMVTTGLGAVDMTLTEPVYMGLDVILGEDE